MIEPTILLQQALGLHQKGQLTQAKLLYEQLLKVNSNHYDAVHFLGVLEYQLHNTQRAVLLLNIAIDINPNLPAPYLNRGAAFRDLKRYDEALASYQQAIKLDPDYAEAFNNAGNVLQDLKRYDEALDSYQQAINLKPDYAEAFNNLGSVLRYFKHYDEALGNYQQAIMLKPSYAEAFNNTGNVLQDLKRYDEALDNYQQAMLLKPGYAEAFNNAGNVLQDLKRYDEALGNYQQAINLKPDYAEALNNKGSVLRHLKRYDEALDNLKGAIVISPNNAGIYLNQGNLLQDLNRHDEALDSYQQAIKLDPDYAEAFNNSGNVLHDLKRHDEALDSYQHAIKLNPDYAEALNNNGSMLRHFKRYEEALDAFERAVVISPNNAGIYLNQGSVYQDLNRYDEAIVSFDKALNINPAHEYLLGIYLHAKMHICDWRAYQSNIHQLEDLIQNGEAASNPFSVLSLIKSPSIQKKAGKIFFEDKFPSQKLLPKLTRHSRHHKIRVGYFSGDFTDHPISYLMAGLFEQHDRDKFEVIAFSFAGAENSAIRKRLQAGFDRFIDVSSSSDTEVALLARKMEVDIAVDLVGSTKHCRPGIFALRAAPIQISYLGFLGTMGVNYMDYIIADQTIIPQLSQQYYEEKVIYLPNYQVNDSKRLVSDVRLTRSELKLPENSFVFCCFNNSYKITPDIFDCWMSILKTVTDSVLFLLSDNKSTELNLKNEARIRGVHESRLIFGGRLEYSRYLARYRVADLFLDTAPYNAGTTASDALWAGLPVITFLGNSFASRVGASILKSINLPELIAPNLQDYQKLAIELANNPKLLFNIKEKLMMNRLTTPLFNTTLFTTHIESAYFEAYERDQRSLPKDHIYVE